jgi:hypothetical protein
MGMDALVNIWVGIDLENSEIDFESICKKLPQEFLDSNGFYKSYFESDHEKSIKSQYGFLPKVIFCGDEYCGFGLVAFKHDWDYGVKKFDVIKISEIVQSKKKDIQNFFDLLEIKIDVDVFVQTDHS